MNRYVRRNMLNIYNLLVDFCEENVEQRLYMEDAIVNIDYFPNIKKAHIHFRRYHELIDATSLDDAYDKFKKNYMYYHAKNSLAEDQIREEVNQDVFDDIPF